MPRRCLRLLCALERGHRARCPPQLLSAHSVSGGTESPSSSGAGLTLAGYRAGSPRVCSALATGGGSPGVTGLGLEAPGDWRRGPAAVEERGFRGDQVERDRESTGAALARCCRFPLLCQTSGEIVSSIG